MTKVTSERTIERTASATWWGSLGNGKGELSSASGALSKNRYTHGTRFGDERGTNAEELIGAAHAGCYSMALAEIMEQRGMPAARIDTDARVTLEKGPDGFEVSNVHLSTRVEAPDAEADAFEEAAEDALDGCVVSRVLDTDITLDATLVT